MMVGVHPISVLGHVVQTSSPSNKSFVYLFISLLVCMVTWTMNFSNVVMALQHPRQFFGLGQEVVVLTTSMAEYLCTIVGMV